MSEGKHVSSEPKQHYGLSNKAYDILKFLAQILLPASGTLYFALAGLWGLPAAEEIVGSITAVDAFLGVILGMSTTSYNKSDARYDGTIDVEDKFGEPKRYTLNLSSDPNELDSKNEVTFKVNPQ